MTDMNTPNQVPQTPQPQQPQAPAPAPQTAPVVPPAAPAPQQPQVKQPAVPVGAPAQTPPAQGFVPPAGQVPPQPPLPGSMVNPMPGMPLTELTGGMKVGWAVLGFLLGPAGILIAWLVNVTNHPAVKSGAIKFSLIGCVAVVVFAVLLSILTVFGMFAATEMLYY